MGARCCGQLAAAPRSIGSLCPTKMLEIADAAIGAAQLPEDQAQ